jgi:hypothetical protein
VEQKCAILKGKEERESLERLDDIDIDGGELRHRSKLRWRESKEL